MAQRDKEWPGYTQWFLCPDCSSLWTQCESGIAAIKRSELIAAPVPSPAALPQQCPVCAKLLEGRAYEI